MSSSTRAEGTRKMLAIRCMTRLVLRLRPLVVRLCPLLFIGLRMGRLIEIDAVKLLCERVRDPYRGSCLMHLPFAHSAALGAAAWAARIGRAVQLSLVC